MKNIGRDKNISNLLAQHCLGMLFQHFIPLLSFLVPDGQILIKRSFRTIDQPDSQVLHRSFEDVFVGLEPSHNLLGSLILPMKVVEGSLNSLEVLQDLRPLCL